MRDADQLLAYARDRVQTAQVPFSLVVKAERRRAWTDSLITAGICAAIALTLGLAPLQNDQESISPWAAKQVLALNIEKDSR